MTAIWCMGIGLVMLLSAAIGEIVGNIAVAGIGALLLAGGAVVVVAAFDRAIPKALS